MLAVLSAQGIGRFIEMPDLFRFYRIFKKGVLDRGVGYEVEEDNAGGPVEVLLVVELIKELLQKEREIQGIHGGQGIFRQRSEKLFLRQSFNFDNGHVSGITLESVQTTEDVIEI